MAITQGEAITQIRARIDEPTAIYWTDVNLRMWINDTARDMARRTECLRDTYNQAATAGTYAYTPAFTSVTQPYRIYRVEFTPTGQTQVYPLEYRDRNSADEIWGLAQAQQTGIPAIWTSWGAPPALTLQVFPSPSVNGTLKLYYYGLPTVLATATSADANVAVDIVDGWEDVLIDGVEYRARRRDNDSDWVQAKQEYEQHLEALMEASIRYTDAFGVITGGVSGGNFLPQWLWAGEDVFM